ncbi:topoisomerase-4 subunit B [Mycoplasmoides fastidiosum]|uniref:DNA topoisomerase (ATP-hydrolyzing) n=1 Tax=Mycoplasmoides fastidiosum TaxID=92758 RepID=A0ABU0LZW6_9BACT|nr:type IIA DNA topoisomerase subunit B [Mycoplasmoides fastidiosum]MDQ0514232.1 topoisomerase-4 subunit B [Mycoplasmoides fastidiosum]UUD37361.1 type IIA DNA topoisomerase subunit B [Mycoplasmoides fastidiosum]
MNKKTNHSYSDESIQVLEELEAVRKRPGMYIGSTNQEGLHHLIWEIVDNSVDEVIAGYANKIVIQLFPDHSVMVQDNGRGIPVGIHKTTKLSTVDTVFTKLHAGGKFGGDSAYKVSGGLHGVGSSVVNALSEFLIVEVARDKTLYQSQFHNGGKIKQALKKIGNTTIRGTKVYFKPDKTIFPICEFRSNIIIERLRETSYLFENLIISFTDQENNTHIFNATEGLAGYVKFMNENRKGISPICFFQGEEEKISVKLAFQYTDEINDSVVSFANSVKTKLGGSHEIGFKNAITEVINAYAKKNKLLKKGDLETSDILEGISAVISVHIPESLIMYEGQTKNKLFTPEAKNAVYKVAVNQISKWLTDNKPAAEAIIKKAILSQESRVAAKKAREEVRKIKTAKNTRMLAGKLTPAQSKKASDNEIFIVEGDSAGGSAKNCRSKFNQAILPLKGKIINAEKFRLIDLLNNDEITSIINAIGVGFGKDIDLKKINYGKIIIMTDADNDGAHIQSLLLTLFYRYMKPLIENNHVYLANPPLYMVKVPKIKKPFYVWTNHEINQLKQKHESVEIKRFKGLGEMQPEQLWETTMNPETRQLVLVTMENISLIERRVLTLMGNDIAIRRDWINENVNFVAEDEIYEK